jgi:hypothetical protein
MDHDDLAVTNVADTVGGSTTVAVGSTIGPYKIREQIVEGGQA